MTVIIASLFLPFTVNFHVNKGRNSVASQVTPPAPAASSAVADTATSSPSAPASLFESSNGNLNSALTPGATTDHESIFAHAMAKADDKQSGYPFPPTSTPPTENPLLTESEAHSPAWGSTNALTQPKAKPLASPSPSILKHADPVVLAKGTTLPKIPETEQPAPYFGIKKHGSVSRKMSVYRKMSFSRADWTVQTAEQGNGGLRNAVRSAKDAGYLDEMIWVGTLGMPTDALADHTRREIAERLEDEYGSLTVFVDDGDFDGHYTHFCKTILWPVFHYQIPDNPKSKAYEDHSWIYYVKLNQAFADRIAASWKRGDSIWIEDYHLLLVPAMLRKLLPDAQIGFFLHIAFPSSEVFKCLAPRKELLEGVLGANLIGFQTSEYCRHFLQTCSRILCVEATNEGIQMEDRFINVGTFPIGIDPTSWDKRRRTEDVEQWVDIISERYQGKRLIVSRDKIDSVRGIRQKLLSYELFLNTYPEWAEKVVLIQVATSTTEQLELEATISDIAMRINSSHSTLAHQPLVFLKQDLAFSQYLALITVADALMITSLREGMNLTSHEFVYCQDGSYGDKKYGSLILSEFTGSASVFGNHALLVNPWDYRQCSEAIHTALTRGEKERKEVWDQLHKAVLQNSTANWVKSFNETLTRVWNEQSAREIMAVPRLSIPRLVDQYRQSKRRLMIVDYEGTLASWGSPRSIILTTPQRAITVLTELTDDPDNVVYVMSSRMPEEMERLFRQVNNLGLIAENGCFVRDPQSDEWARIVSKAHIQTWKKSVSNILAYFKDRTEGSWVEELHCSLVFHYGSAENHPGAGRLAAECADHINDACSSYGVHAVPVEGALIVETMSVTKASATEQVWKWCLKAAEELEETVKPDFLLVMGDNREDEPVFRWANELQNNNDVDYSMTVTLGSRSTEAKATLTQGVTGVLACLQQLPTTSKPAVQ
ncbi:hypothetical protein N7478_002499 [Penicillium angulare]|uniref:uncharacterized protein n=1 Tax=Penicillium angulare TaxID=116970 RepID=UPI002541401C|nr:uncharacterized protein N7478_002499 [Penicillium angulare]KAJ5286813.1 hypothetical protein N7478_002499 [Penicillium angulare]